MHQHWSSYEVHFQVPQGSSTQIEKIYPEPCLQCLLHKTLHTSVVCPCQRAQYYSHTYTPPPPKLLRGVRANELNPTHTLLQKSAPSRLLGPRIRRNRPLGMSPQGPTCRPEQYALCNVGNAKLAVGWLFYFEVFGPLT